MRYVVEMTPAWGAGGINRGVVTSGPVGHGWLERWALFRYGIHRWRDCAIPDIDSAIGGALQITSDAIETRRLFDLVPQFPLATRGGDELAAGDMWNSNSLVAWLISMAGIDVGVSPPANGCAPAGPRVNGSPPGTDLQGKSPAT